MSNGCLGLTGIWKCYHTCVALKMGSPIRNKLKSSRQNWL